ncbi:MAG TPA: nucleoside hydrolase [Bryobacteraceae bacterium]|nr:nucleoside hydrolase [Bryobacteraceae bacterium]
MIRSFLVAAFFAAFSLPAQTRTPVLIDTDIGDAVDDSLALGLALASPELDVRGVTTVIDDVDSKTRLAWKELVIFGRRDIPLAMGAPEPLLDAKLPSHPAAFHILTSSDRIPESAHRPAASFLVDTLMNSRDKLTLIAIGPLTNVALALKIEPRIKERIERIAVMGGAFAARQAEYNVKRDPVAAEVVFLSGVPILAVGLDVTAPCRLRAEDLESLRVAQSPTARFLLRQIELSQSETGQALPTLYDPLAVAAVFRPDLVETAAGKVEVSLANDDTRGQTRFTADPAATTRVGVKVNAQAFLDLFIKRIANAGVFGGSR